MAGYIMTFNDLDALKKAAMTGLYSTKIKVPINDRWKTHHEYTAADFATMKQGDNIYLFHKRKIYGIGELVNINGDCKFLNFPHANKPNKFLKKDIINDAIVADKGWIEREQRWVCTFIPSPHFFNKGIDMDAALKSDPSAFKMLRAFEKLSFVKIDDVENQALKNIIVKVFEDKMNNSNYYLSDKTSVTHDRIKHLIVSVK
uniref:hypothetical protein n=1 Tax=uncultured Allobacillus sp. TaxID=1638025 RepID=UPI00259579A8|nr:hypothetical protein [uncultured Allobacillus sp.]